MTTTRSRNRGLFDDLAALFTASQIVTQGGATYEQMRQLWNGRVKTQPTAIVRCLSVQDIIHTVRRTRAHELPISVRRARSDFAGRALSKNHIAIDLPQMCAVTYGLGTDNLLSAQMMTADEQLLIASTEEHVDLLW